MYRVIFWALFSINVQVLLKKSGELQKRVTQPECGMGAGAEIAKALVNSLHDPSNATVFFANYFAGLPRFICLEEQINTYSLEILRSNTISHCPIETYKALRKQRREP